MTRNLDVQGEPINYQHLSTIPGSSEWPILGGFKVTFSGVK